MPTPTINYGTPPPPTQQAIVNDFSYILDNATRCATFTCGGSLPILTNPSRDESGKLTPRTEEKVQDQRVLTKGVTFRWGDHRYSGKATVPQRDDEEDGIIHEFVAACMPATFGRDGKDVYDETYRRAGALGVEDFMTDFCPYEAGIIDIVTQLLLPPITGDLKPSPPPPRPKLAAIDNISHTHGVEIYNVIYQLARRNGDHVDAGHVEPCLAALDIGPADAQEMLVILGQLDPRGTGVVLMEQLVELMAKRVKDRFPQIEPAAPDSRQVHKKMIARGIRAELYKLNVYSGPSGLFKPHVDTPRSEMQIGSLVVCLPVEFEGGALAVKHQQEEVVYDWATPASNKEQPCIQWAAFYSDCEHEVREVTSGHRVTLTYNLFLAPGTSLLTGQPTSLDREHLPLAVNLRTMLANDEFMPNGGYIGVHLAHHYPHTHPQLHEFIPQMLKGVDMVLYESIASLGLSAVLCPASETNLPSSDAMDALSGRRWRNTARRDPKVPVHNILKPFEVDFFEVEGVTEEADVLQELNDHPYFDVSDEDDPNFGDYGDMSAERYEMLEEWKPRFEGRKKICWLNKSKHQELSRAFMAVCLSVIRWLCCQCADVLIVRQSS